MEKKLIGQYQQCQQQMLTLHHYKHQQLHQHQHRQQLLQINRLLMKMVVMKLLLQKKGKRLHQFWMILIKLKVLKVQKLFASIVNLCFVTLEKELVLHIYGGILVVAYKGDCMLLHKRSNY
ncbi:hypothetical protein AHAS_Ahas09G0161000 [Arachis hypogaea]